MEQDLNSTLEENKKLMEENKMLRNEIIKIEKIKAIIYAPLE